MNSQINQPSKGGGGGGTRLSRGGWPGNGGVRGDGDTRGGRGEDGGFVDVVVTGVAAVGVEMVMRSWMWWCWRKDVAARVAAGGWW
ncbi:hypothetical protein Tco_1007124 [Tanacetum coccineum]